MPTTTTGRCATRGRPARGAATRLTRVGAAAAAGLAVLAATVLTASPAQAAITRPGQLELGTHPIPAVAPAAKPYGWALPPAPGTMGNPTQLFMHGGASTTRATSQVLSVPDGGVPWETPARTRTATGGRIGEQWRFQHVGRVGLINPAVVDDADFAPVLYPVYKVIHYDGVGGHTCLDALGGSGATGSAVGAYGCDPNGFNQYNQLWVLGGRSTMVPTVQAGFQALGDLTTKVGRDGSLVVQSLASLAGKNWRTMDAPILTASTDNFQGTNSRLTLQDPEYVVTTQNSTWFPLSIDPPSTWTVTPAPTPAPAPVSYGCTGFACLLTGIPAFDGSGGVVGG